MKRRIISVFLSLIIVLSHTVCAYASEVRNYEVSSENFFGYGVESETPNIPEKALLDTMGWEKGKVDQQINRSGICYCLGGDSWGHITGDNNAIGEGVYVTNLMSKNIEIKGYTEKGKLRGTYTLIPGQSGWFGFWIWDGTYYFKVRFEDHSEGEISVYMKSDWYIQ